MLLAVPVVVYSEMVQHLLSFHARALPGSALIPPVLGIAVFSLAGGRS